GFQRERLWIPIVQRDPAGRAEARGAPAGAGRDVRRLHCAHGANRSFLKIRPTDTEQLFIDCQIRSTNLRISSVFSRMSNTSGHQPTTQARFKVTLFCESSSAARARQGSSI